MAYLIVNENGTECITKEQPIRNFNGYWIVFNGYDSPSRCDDNLVDNVIRLRPGTIEKILGRKMTWEDSPINI